MQRLVASSLLSLSLALALPAPFALAQNPAPDALLRSVADEVIDKLKLEQDAYAANPAKMAALVETRILPLFDFVQMTRLAAARHWHLATPEQQRVLAEEFKTLLVRTYATALTQYRDEAIVFRQLRAVPQDATVTVRSEVKQPGRERMTLDYDLEETPEGWKIYGVKLAGVCLITTYRDVFSEKIRDGGVDGLIAFLADSNRGGSSRFKAIKTAFWEKSQVMYAIFQKIIRSGWR